MRSRYTAFVLGHREHLLRSWAPERRPDDVAPDPSLTWRGLTILSTERGLLLDRDGVVEFQARFARPEGEGALHERSRFRRDAGRWVYVDGDILPPIG